MAGARAILPSARTGTWCPGVKTALSWMICPVIPVDSPGLVPDKNGMDSVVVKCAFCTRRYAITLEGIDVWFVRCDCGARGFTQNDHELIENRHTDRPGFTAKESATRDGERILLADPIAVFVDEWARRWYVSWFLFMAKRPDETTGTWSHPSEEGNDHQQ